MHGTRFQALAPKCRIRLHAALRRTTQFLAYNLEELTMRSQHLDESDSKGPCFTNNLLDLDDLSQMVSPLEDGSLVGLNC